MSLADGGAIWTDGTLAVDGATFTKNYCADQEKNKLYNGGAIYLNGIDKQVTIVESTFTENETKYNCGGAICNHGSDLSITTSTFNGNHATHQGGAIYVNDPHGDLIVDDSFFANNKADTLSFGYGGGAIYINNGGSVKVDNTGFSNNTCAPKGTTDDAGGGAVYIITDKTVTFTATEEETSQKQAISFTNNQSNNGCGGAIFVKKAGEVTVTGYTFKGNTAAKDGGAIYSKAENGDDPVKVNGCTFTGNNAKGNGGAIFAHKLTLGGSGGSFKGNTAVNGKAIAINNNSASGWYKDQGSYSFDSGQDVAYLKS